MSNGRAVASRAIAIVAAIQILWLMAAVLAAADGSWWAVGGVTCVIGIGALIASRFSLSVPYAALFAALEALCILALLLAMLVAVHNPWFTAIILAPAVPGVVAGLLFRTSAITEGWVFGAVLCAAPFAAIALVAAGIYGLMIIEPSMLLFGMGLGMSVRRYLQQRPKPAPV